MDEPIDEEFFATLNEATQAMLRKRKEAKEKFVKEELIGIPGAPVPTVDPADLQALWRYTLELRAQYPNGGVGTDINALKNLLSPGADTRAVAYRSSMLWLLEMMLESAWPGGQLSESAFKVAARMELQWVPVGGLRKGFPFDLERFIAEVQGESMFGGTVAT